MSKRKPFKENMIGFTVVTFAAFSRGLSATMSENPLPVFNRTSKTRGTATVRAHLFSNFEMNSMLKMED